MSTIILVRPGCTDFDEQNRIQGTLDLPLNERGQEQVRRTIEELRDSPLEIVYTSPCEPARSTAAQIGQALDLPVKELEGLRNLNQGLWQGLQVDDLRRKQPRVFKQFQESPESICPPQGELVRDAMERVRKSLEKPLKRGISFAVVASEPLATMIASVATGRKLEFTGPLTQSCGERIWEILRPEGTPASGKYPSDDGRSGIPVAVAHAHRGHHTD